MSWFDKDRRFDELFSEWFDGEFREWLVDNGYAEVDRVIDLQIGYLRDCVDIEFQEWKKSFLAQEE